MRIFSYSEGVDKFLIGVLLSIRCVVSIEKDTAMPTGNIQKKIARQEDKMSIAIVVPLMALAGCFVSSCATPPERPAWAVDADTAYPPEKYIAQKDYGGDRQKAELSGLEALSRYFVSEVQSTTRGEMSYTGRDGVSSQTAQFDERVFVQSQTKLFAVRYTDPYQNPHTGGWETLAYIDRNEAWNIYEPVLRQGAESFLSLYRAAEAESESFRQVFLYGAAHRAALEFVSDFSRELSFARILNPAAAEQFDGVLTAAASIPQKMSSAKSRSTIFIQCTGDSDGMIYTAVSKALGAQGFPVTTNRTAAAIMCEVNISENKQTLPAGTFYTPSVNIVLNGRTQSLFSFSASANERIGANNPDVARQRAYTAIAYKLGETFRVDVE
jgi:hypothetical protein